MLMSEQELDSMLGEVGGTCNFENMLKCFEVKLTGEGMANDGDELVLEAMKAYNETSKINILQLKIAFLGCIKGTLQQSLLTLLLLCNLYSC